MCGYAKEAGADAVVIAPPYYFPISEDEMKDYLKSLVPELSLPFVLYNMPECTKIHLSLDFVRFAKDLGALGIKDSSGDLGYLHDLIFAFRNASHFSVIAGTESFLSSTILHGGQGAIAGGANFFPKLFVDLYNASLNGDLLVIEQLNKQVERLYDTIYSVGRYSSRITKGTKCALSVLRICDDYMALPLRRFDTAERGKIEEYVHQFRNSLTY